MTVPPGSSSASKSSTEASATSPATAERPGLLEIALARGDLAVVEREQGRFTTGAADRVLRLLELDSLDAVGGEDRHPAALQ